jgi:uncharacterized transporter YbjL
MTPNRIVALIVALLGLVAGALPALADLDWQSTAGVVSGAVVVLGVAVKWLEGWQAYEATQPAQSAAAAHPAVYSTSGFTSGITSGGIAYGNTLNTKDAVQAAVADTVRAEAALATSPDVDRSSDEPFDATKGIK